LLLVTARLERRLSGAERRAARAEEELRALRRAIRGAR
jgi:hypothetical protein